MSKKGISIKFTVPLPDKYAPISVSLWTERDKLPDETEEEMIINVGKELVSDLHKISESLVVEILGVEKQIMEDLNDA